MSTWVLLGTVVAVVLVPPLGPDRAAPAPVLMRHGVRVVAAAAHATIPPCSFRADVTGATRIRRVTPPSCSAWQPPLTLPYPLAAPASSARSPP